MKRKGAIYSIGYQKRTPGQILDVCDALGIAWIVDVRAVPSSRKPGFHRSRLQSFFGARYVWQGPDLGNKPPVGDVTAGGLRYLCGCVDIGHRIMLMCLEEAPGECHRHIRIATALLPAIDVVHVFRDQLVKASDLQAASDAGAPDYPCETLTLAEARP